MAKFPAMPLWTDAFLADTIGWSDAEVGAYLLLLMAAWRTREVGLPQDEQFLARVARSGRRWPHIRIRVMACWHIAEDGLWHQHRLDNVHKIVSVNVEQKKQAAKSKWLKIKNVPLAAASEPHTVPHPDPHIPTKTIVEKELPGSSESLIEKAEHSVASRVAVFNNSNLQKLADIACLLVGVDPAKDPAWAITMPIAEWLRSGCEPDDDILPAIADAMARRKAKKQGPPGGWRYFERSVLEARDRRLQGLPPVKTLARPGNGMVAAAESRVPWKPPENEPHLTAEQKAKLAVRIGETIKALRVKES